MIIPDGDRRRPKAAPTRKTSSRRRKILIALAVIAVILIGIRIALAPVVLHVANRKLNEIPEYRGHIGAVDIALLRGAYQIKDVTLRKVEGASTVPFFAADLVDLSVEWGALFHGKLVGEVELYGPRLNFVKAPTKKASQTSIDTSWEDRSREMFPLDINRFAVHEGEIHFRDLTTSPKVDVRLDRIEALAKGLTTRPSGNARALPATFHATARAMDQAKVRLDMKLDPWAKHPTFDMDGELTQLKLPVLNDFLKAYANVTAKEGTFSLYTEMAADSGRFKGYVKPIMKDVQVFSPTKSGEGLAQKAWEALVQGVEDVLENKPKSQLATDIPLSGKFSNPTAGIWSSVGSLLRNGFVRALRPSLSHSVDFKDVTGGKKQGITPEESKKNEAKAKAEP